MDRNFQKDRLAPQSPKSSTLRRRLTSRLQPLHGGLGFGANAIRERALVVARQATQRRAPSSYTGPAHSPVESALGPLGDGLQFAEEKTVIRDLEIPVISDIDLPDQFAQKRDVLNHQIRRSSQSQKDQLGQALSRAAQVPSIKSFISPPQRPRPPSVVQSLIAWFFDTLVVVTCLLAGFTLSASVPFMGLLAHQFPTLFNYNPQQISQAGSLGWMVLMMQTLTLASIMMFLVQTFSGIFFSASVGRAIVNVQFSASRSVLGRGLKIGFGELVQWPFAFGLLNAIVSPEHNFIIRSLRWNRAGSSN
jgi:hypothetical protein